MILPSKQKSSGGGHTILNGSGSAMTQRAGLQFEGMGVTDDSTNDRTKVKLPIFTGTTAAWEELSSAEKAKYTIVNFSNDYGGVILLGSYERTFTATASGNAEVGEGGFSISDDLSLYKFVCVLFQLRRSSNNSYDWGSGSVRGNICVYSPLIKPMNLQQKGVGTSNVVDLYIATTSATNKSPYVWAAWTNMSESINAFKVLLYGIN